VPATLLKYPIDRHETHKQTIAYEHFWDMTHRVSNFYKFHNQDNDVEDNAKSLLDINPEGELLREVKDILDELHIMINIKIKQQQVLKQFRKHVEYILVPNFALSKEIGTANQNKVIGDVDGEESVACGSKNDKGKNGSKSEDDKVERDAKWTLKSAIDLSASLDDRIADLNALKESAEYTEKAASFPSSHIKFWKLIETGRWTSWTKATASWGCPGPEGCPADGRNTTTRSFNYALHCCYNHLRRSFISFKVIKTLTFPSKLPLSFGTGLFGMNAKEINGGLWTIGNEMTYMSMLMDRTLHHAHRC
jgi:hypothetical protein